MKFAENVMREDHDSLRMLFDEIIIEGVRKHGKQRGRTKK